MIRHCLLWLFWLWVAFAVPQAALAQVDEFSAVADWDAVSTRAENVVTLDETSLFSLNRLRDELFVWRNTFAQDRGLNADRLRTVNAQLSALGTPPENGEEPSDIATRRAELEAQRDALRGPALLAEEAYVHADGLIAEVDAAIRDRQRRALFVRAPTPLNPTIWPVAISGLWTGVQSVAAEAYNITRATSRSGSLWSRAPIAVLMIAAGALVLLRGKFWGQSWLAARTWSRQGEIAFDILIGLLSIGGFLLLLEGVDRLDIVGLQGSPVLDAIGVGGVLVLVSRFIAGQFYPESAIHAGPMGQPLETRNSARSVTQWLGWGVAALGVVTALMQVTAVEPVTVAVATFPLVLLLAYGLFRIGQLIQTPSEESTGMILSTGQTRRLLGKLVVAVAIVSPILAAIGYAAASDALLFPTIITLGILAVLLLLQRMIFDFWQGGPQGSDDQGPLFPILIGIALFLLSLPLLAMAWGARVADLVELWERFQAGFDIGETTISPTDFLTFLLVFAIGYFLTSFVKSALANTVLPRTSLDLGARNAVVAGVGYVGIFVAAVVAITSAGIDLSNLAIVAGALSVGIGFGLQNIVSNFVSGIILLIERPIGEGDWIEVNGQMGYVRNISVRSTSIETFDRTDVIIPNADLVSGQVTNWTRGNSVGRVIVPVGVAYGTDVKKVEKVLLDIAQAHPLVLMYPEPSVIFMGFGASSLDFEIRAILRDVNFVLSTKSEMNFEIARRFAEEGIEIPFPQRDVWIRNADGLPAAEKSEGTSDD